MVKRKILALLICCVASVTALLVLNTFTGWQQQNGNGFVRQLPSHKIVGKGFVKLDGNTWYLAGGDSNTIYLGSKRQGNQLLKISWPQKDTQVVFITGFDTMKLYRSMYLRSFGNKIYLLDGVKPVILSGELGEHEFKKKQRVPFFTTATTLKDDQFVLRVVQKDRKNALVTASKDSISKPFILEADGDGQFSTDGVLTSSPDGSRIFYSYYYRNLFYCLDSNLNVLYKGKSIDTVSHSHVEVAKIKSHRKTTLSAPPAVVKSQIAATAKWLFIHSKMKAENETEKTMSKVSVVDVYDVKDGQYQFSFYLGNIDGKMRDFKVYGNTLVALYDHCLYFHRLLF